MLCKLPLGTRLDTHPGPLIFSPNVLRSKKHALYARKAVEVSHKDAWTGAWVVRLVENRNILFQVQREQLKVLVDRELEDYL